MHVVIMGGTSGIGLATAELLAKDGAEVTVTGRDPAKLAAFKAGAAERVDATSSVEVNAFLDRIGRFEHLVLAFSESPGGMHPITSLDLARVRAAFESKVFGYLG